MKHCNDKIVCRGYFFYKIDHVFIDIFISIADPWQMSQNKIEIAAIQMLELIKLLT